jgi:hypothetical protein
VDVGKKTKNEEDFSIIIPNKLFLGNERASQYKELLLNHGVTAILNCSHDCVNSFEGTFVYLKVEIEDDHDVVLSKHYASVHKFLNENEVVFVHCQSGVSRSAALLMSWLMKAKGVPLARCWSQLKAIRSIVLPNVSFMYQLSVYDKELFGSQSLNLIDYMTEFFSPLFEDLMSRDELYAKIESICSNTPDLDTILTKIYNM